MTEPTPFARPLRIPLPPPPCDAGPIELAHWHRDVVRGRLRGINASYGRLLDRLDRWLIGSIAAAAVWGTATGVAVLASGRREAVVFCAVPALIAVVATLLLWVACEVIDARWSRAARAAADDLRRVGDRLRDARRQGLR